MITPKRRKKLQVFISSTYQDLKSERQAAVSAILKAGHIPAGMELFTAGDESQLEVIKRWIDESDVLMLILGSRYGTLEPISGLSYTQFEYNYARDLKKPIFAIVMDDHSYQLNWAKFSDAQEAALRRKYEAFKKEVKSSLCAFFTDEKDIRIAIYESLKEINDKFTLSGWISGADVKTLERLSAEKELLLNEITKLKAELRVAKEQVTPKAQSATGAYNGLTFEQCRERMKSIKIELPEWLKSEKSGADPISLITGLRYLLSSAAGTVTNAYGISRDESWLFYQIATPLLPFGLVKHGKTPVDVKWSKLTVSPLGYRFLAEMEKAKSVEQNQSNPPPAQNQKSRKRK